MYTRYLYTVISDAPMIGLSALKLKYQEFIISPLL